MHIGRLDCNRIVLDHMKVQVLMHPKHIEDESWSDRSNYLRRWSVTHCDHRCNCLFNSHTTPTWAGIRNAKAVQRSSGHWTAATSLCSTYLLLVLLCVCVYQQYVCRNFLPLWQCPTARLCVMPLRSLLLSPFRQSGLISICVSSRHILIHV